VNSLLRLPLIALLAFALFLVAYWAQWREDERGRLLRQEFASFEACPGDPCDL